MRRSHRWGALAAAITALLLSPAGAAAHTELQGTRPAEGSRLARAPAAVVVDYSAPLAEVVEASVTAGGEEIAGRPRLAAADAGRVRIPLLGDRRTGRFSVRWVVRSADAHLLEGSVDFSVAEPSLGRVIAPVVRALLESSAVLADAAARAPTG